MSDTSFHDGDASSIPNGPVVAACWSGALGMLAMAIAVITSHGSDAVKKGLIQLGNFLPVVGPNSTGAFAGHQMVLLLTWLLSWLLLHLLLQRKDFRGPGWLLGCLGVIALSTLLHWPPLYKVFTGKY